MINLKTMQSEVNLPTYFIQGQPKDLTQLLIADLPKYLDVSNSHYAYVHKEVNKEDTLVELKKQLDESILAKNIFIKDAAD